MRGPRWPVARTQYPAPGVLCLFLIGCGASEPLTSNVGALGIERVLSRGALAYAVAFDGDDVVSVELTTQFDLVVRDRSRETLRVRLGPPDWDVNDLAVHDHIAYLASADGSVRAIDLQSGAERARWRLGDAGTAVAVSSDGSYVATGTAAGVLCLRRLPGGELLQCLVAHDGRIAGLAFDRAGGRLASASRAGGAAVWSVPALAALASLDTGGSANAVAFSPDGDRIAVATSALPPDPRRLRDERARVLLWRPVRGGPPPVLLSGHTGAVVAVAWVGRRVVSAAFDRTVRLWDSGRSREIARVSRFAHVLRDVAVSDDHRRVAAAAWAPRADDPATTLLALRHPP
jgi:WD40 repeat protein